MSDRGHPKRAFLEAAGALHAHPDRVQAALFRRHRFFDPLDKVQVKYEMLRAHVVDGEPVTTTALTFGFSRQTFYMDLAGFEQWGLLGLADEVRGRRGPAKLTAEAIAHVQALVEEAPKRSGREIAEQLLAQDGIAVHRRTIERLVASLGKKDG